MLSKFVVLTLLTVGLSASAQTTRKAETNNRPPTVMLTADRNTLCYGGWVKLSATTSDADGDKLTYKYTVTSGRIKGTGRKVRWFVADLDSNRVTVEVSDGRGGVAIASASVVNFELCSCPSQTVTGSVDLVGSKPSATFTLMMQGGQFYRKPGYFWSVSAGKIVRGKSKPVVTVDLTNVETEDITATVKIKGLAPECPNENSATVRNPSSRPSPIISKP